MNSLRTLSFSSKLFGWLCAIGLLVISTGLFSEELGVASSEDVKTSLERLNPLIGQWRGTGQVRRGSTRGAWRQTGEFVWDFSADGPAIAYHVEDGKLVESGRITWTAKDRYQFTLATAEGEKRLYVGDWQNGKLVFVRRADADGIQYRMTVTPLNEKRTLVLHEKTTSGGSSFFRIAEVGYTRSGTRLALPGGGRRECVVTGGTAQTEVKYNGETYYVCCSGCKQAFDDDPEGIIADFKARLKERLDQVRQ